MKKLPKFEKKELKEVTYETIAELRKRKLFVEATKLLNAHQDSLKINKEQMQKEFRAIYAKKYRIKNRDKINAYHKEYYQRKKAQSQITP